VEGRLKERKKVKLQSDTSDEPASKIW